MLTTAEVLVVEPAIFGARLRVAEPDSASVGHKPERDCSTSASAWRRRASANCTFWFDRSTWSASALSFASPNISHHLPRLTASLGCAGFQSPISLNAGADGADGRT